MSKSRIFPALLLGAALTFGCSQQKPAEQAVAAAEQALAEVHESALKYVPDRYAEVKIALDAARNLLQREKFGEALAAAREIPAQAKAIGAEAAAAREKLQAQLEARWPQYVASLPGRMAELEARLKELSALKKLPEGLEARDLRSAGDALRVATEAWPKAVETFEAGDLERAVARGEAVEFLVNRGLQTLGSPPAD